MYHHGRTGISERATIDLSCTPEFYKSTTAAHAIVPAELKARQVGAYLPHQPAAQLHVQGLQPGLLPASPERLALGPLQEPARTCRYNAHHKRSQLPCSIPDTHRHQSPATGWWCVMAEVDRARSENQFIPQIRVQTSTTDFVCRAESTQDRIIPHQAGTKLHVRAQSALASLPEALAPGKNQRPRKAPAMSQEV